MNTRPISIAPLLQKQAQVSITVNNHQSGLMQAPDGRQMYVRTHVQSNVVAVSRTRLRGTL
jgi:hypothetical protein